MEQKQFDSRNWRRKIIISLVDKLQVCKTLNDQENIKLNDENCKKLIILWIAKSLYEKKAQEKDN